MKSTKLYDSKFVKLHSVNNTNYMFASRRDVPYIDSDDKAFSDGVFVIAYDEQGRLLVNYEYRPAIGKFIWAFPAGLVDKGESIEQAAIREVREETGLDLVVDTSYKNNFVSPGLVDERVGIVVGRVSGTLIRDGQTDTEDIEPMLLTPHQISLLVESKQPMSIWLATHLIGG